MKLMKVVLAFFAMALAMLAGPAFAISPFDPLTAAVSFTDVIAAVMALAVILAGVHVALKGVTTLLHFIKRG